MIITTTAIGFLTLSVGLAFCGWMFFRAFKKTNGDSKIGHLISSIFLGFSLQNGIVGIGMLFFIRSPEIVFFTLVLSHFLVISIGMLGIYTSHYIFSPNSSAKFPIAIVVLFGIMAVTFLIADHPQPFLTTEKGIDMDFDFKTSLTTFYIFLISIGSTSYIFTKLFFRARHTQIKVLSFALTVLGVLGIINIFVRFVLFYETPFEVRTRIFDIGLGIIGAIFIIVIFLLPKLKIWIQSKKSIALPNSED